MEIEVHTCPRCELRFAGVIDLRDHLRRDHAEPEEVVPPPDPVVVPLDPARPASDRALRVAAALARQGGYPLRLVGVRPPGLSQVACDAYLTRHARRTRARGVDVLGRIVLDAPDPAAAVIAHVEGQPCSFLCLASHGRSAVGEAVLGSVSEAIVRGSPVPVLLVGPSVEDADAAIGRVIACVGDDGSAAAVVETARSLASTLGARASLLQIVGDDTRPNPMLESGALHDLLAGMDPEQPCEILYRGAPPAVAIVEHLRAEAGTLLVVGTQAPPGLRRLRRGSVAIDLVRQAPFPVLIAPSALGDHPLKHGPGVGARA